MYLQTITSLKRLIIWFKTRYNKKLPSFILDNVLNSKFVNRPIHSPKLSIKYKYIIELNLERSYN